SSSSCCNQPTITSSAHSAALSTSTRSTRFPASRTTPRSPATYRARACSRHCSRSWRVPSRVCHRRVAVNIRNRNSCKSIPPISYSCAAARSPALRRSFQHAAGRARSVFGAEVIAPEDRKQGEIFQDVEPEDLLKYGLIPEFVGRLPIVATLEDLDEPSLKLILTRPKNALDRCRQRDTARVV